jgi:two-component system chemotaxis response regulator CheB
MRADRGVVRVLLVDDSAVVRELVQQLFERDASLSVAVAADPLIAMRKMRESRPHVILLDLAMPRMDGLVFLRKLMAEDPIPVVVFSSTTGSTDSAMRALEDGAVDIVTKPSIDVRGFLEERYATLVDVVRAAAQAKVAPRMVLRKAAPVAPAQGRPKERADVVAMGASTGGTEALATILGGLRADAPPVLVVQHMPEGFTAAFAKRLDGCCAVRVREARNGDLLEQGLALIAPGNHHLLLRRGRHGYHVETSGAPLVSRHRPSVDVLFRSVAETAGARAMGILLTGMGADGADGLLEMRRGGAATIAQDEASCVVFGMPKEAILRGAAESVLPIVRIADAVMA